jgi:hypothetical protein
LNEEVFEVFVADAAAGDVVKCGHALFGVVREVVE